MSTKLYFSAEIQFQSTPSSVLLPQAIEELKQTMYFCFPLKYEGKKELAILVSKKSVMKDVLNIVTGKSCRPLIILRATGKRLPKNGMPRHNME